MKPHGSRINQSEARHKCDRRGSKRLLCSDLAQLLWVDAHGGKRCEIVILENLSLSGIGLFMGVAVAERTPVQLIANDLQLSGSIQHCSFRENGYVVGLELDSGSKWAQEPGSEFLPEHLLDVSLLELD